MSNTSTFSTANKAANNKATQRERDKLIVMLGDNSLQDSMLIGNIRQHTKVRCQMATLKDWQSWILPTESAPGRPLPKDKILLVDVSPVDCSQLDEIMLELGQQKSVKGTIQLAMMNVLPESWAEERVRWSPVNGLFYKGGPHRQLTNGLKSLLRNEYWIPRHLTQRHWENLRPAFPSTAELLKRLTPRELQTLMAMKSGGSNSEIADRMNVSPHTIKTYLYNIYPKLLVRNRTEATIWARRHL